MVRLEPAELVAVFICLDSELVRALAATTDEDLWVNAIELDKLDSILVLVAAADDTYWAIL